MAGSGIHLGMVDRIARRPVVSSPAIQPRPSASQPKPSVTRSNDRFEAPKAKPVELSPAVDAAKRARLRDEARAGFRTLIGEIGSARPPLSEETVSARANALRAKVFQAATEPEDGPAGNAMYNSLVQLGRARQYLENGEVDRAKAVLDIDTDAYAGTRFSNATYDGAHARLNQAYALGLLQSEDLRAFHAVAGPMRTQLGVLDPAVKLTETANKTLADLTALSDWSASKNDVTSVGGFYTATIGKAREIAADIKRIMALPDDASPPKAFQLEQAIARAKSEVSANFPKGQDPVKVIHEYREAMFDLGQRLGEMASAIPGPMGKALSAGIKSIDVGLRYASGDIDSREALSRGLVIAVETFVGPAVAKLGGPIGGALRAGALKALTVSTQDAATVFNNPRLTPDQKLAEFQRVVRNAAIEGAKEAVVTAVARFGGGLQKTEDLGEVYEGFVAAMKSLGVEQYVKKPLDDLKALSSRKEAP